MFEFHLKLFLCSKFPQFNLKANEYIAQEHQGVKQQKDKDSCLYALNDVTFEVKKFFPFPTTSIQCPTNQQILNSPSSLTTLSTYLLFSLSIRFLYPFIYKLCAQVYLCQATKVNRQSLYLMIEIIPYKLEFGGFVFVSIFQMPCLFSRLSLGLLQISFLLFMNCQYVL